MTAAGDWAKALDAWQIPEQILARTAESPWDLPPPAFAKAARHALARPLNPTHLRALEALPNDGTLLDVGCGAGAASLPLASRAKVIVAVDESPAMLEEMLSMARNLAEVVTHQGTWPQCADEVKAVDVAVCANVAYNVRALGPFVTALTQHSRERVVLELTDRHPQSSLNWLWLHFWSLQRPTGPSASDAAAVIAEALGEGVNSTHWTREEPVLGGLDADRVAWIRRRLCLPPSREAELAGLLEGAGPEAPTPMVTLWWPGRA